MIDTKDKRDDICPTCKSNEFVTTLYLTVAPYDCPMRFCHSCQTKFKRAEPAPKGEK